MRVQGVGTKQNSKDTRVKELDGSFLLEHSEEPDEADCRS